MKFLVVWLVGFMGFVQDTQLSTRQFLTFFRGAACRTVSRADKQAKLLFPRCVSTTASYAVDATLGTAQSFCAISKDVEAGVWDVETQTRHPP